MNAARAPLLHAGTLFLALFAVTLNFLQPLAHAAAMRSGKADLLWSVLCSAAITDPDRAKKGNDPTSGPVSSTGIHECCLGLAHAPILVLPSSDFTSFSPFEATPAQSLPAEHCPSVGIRDGPPEARGPPFP